MTTYRPDHNGECLDCDEPLDAHLCPPQQVGTAETERQITEVAAYRLLLKFHRETDCGKGGDHWAECDALVDTFGWATWEVWNNVASRLGVVRR